MGVGDPIHIPFTGGIHQETDPAVGEPGTLARAENVRMSRAGGFFTRYGTDVIPQTVSATSNAIDAGLPHGAASMLGREIMALDGRVYARDEVVRPSWQEVGRVGRHLPIKGHWIALDSDANVTNPPHVAAMTGSVAFAYSMSGGSVRLIVCDEAMTQRYSTVISSRENPRIFVVGSVYVLTYESGANIIGRTFDPATLTLGAENTIAARATGNDRYDAAPFNSTQFLWCARTAAADWTVELMTVGFVTSASRVITVPNTVHAYERVYGVAAEGVYAAYFVAGGVTGTVAALPVTLASSLTSTYGTNQGQHPGFTRRNSTSVWLTWVDQSSAATADDVHFASVDNAAVVTSYTSAMYALTLASLPFNGSDGNCCVWVHSRTNVSGAANVADRYTLATFFLEDPAGRMVLCPELTSDSRASLSHGNALSGLKSTGAVATIGNRYFSAILSDVGSHTSVLCLEHEDATETDSCERQIINCAGVAMIGGGHLQEVTFGRVNDVFTMAERRGFENGFVRDPFQLPLTDLGAASGILAAGIYQVQVVYEYIDTAGRIHQSAPSANRTITTGGANRAIRVTLGSCLYTERDMSARSQSTRAVPYVTTAGGSTFYEYSSVSAHTTSVTVTLDIGVAIDIDTSARTIPTSGNRFANRPVPSHRVALPTHDALWVAGLWDRRMVERSKTIIPNETARFTRADQFRAIAPFEIDSVAELDDQILWLGQDGLCVSDARGPNDQGNPNIPTPTVLSNTGCVAPKSVIRIPPGVLFFGRRGFYLVPRGGGEPEFIGSPVQEDILAVYSAAYAIEDNRGDNARTASRLVAFSVLLPGAVRRTVLLDQDTLQWVSEDTNFSFVLGSWNGSLVYLPEDATQGNILLASTSEEDAGGEAILARAETTWLRPFDLLGFGFVRRAQLLVTVLEVNGNGIFLDYARDGAAYAEASATAWRPAATGVQVFEWTIPTDQPCNTIRFRVRETVEEVGAVTAGVIYHGISLDVDPQKGLARLPPAKRL